MKKLNFRNSVIFHGGLNKAGSSYLQKLFSRNFLESISSQVCYPGPSYSSGNAGSFSQAVRQLDKRLAMKNLHRLLSQASEGQTVLLSTEYAYHQFVKTCQRDLFYQCFAEFGIEHPTFVFSFRNVFNHAVSAYYHRCGLHAMPSFENWISGYSIKNVFQRGVSSYEFWEELDLFLSASEDKRFALEYMPYSKKMKAWWSAFLGVHLDEPISRNVNVSVTPSEAELLRQLRCSDETKALETRRALKEMNPEKKATDNDLLSNHFSLVGEQVAKYHHLIQRAEELIGFGISSPPEKLSERVDGTVKLSDQQLSLIIDVITRKKSMKQSLRERVPFRVRPVVQKVYRAFARDA